MKCKFIQMISVLCIVSIVYPFPAAYSAPKPQSVESVVTEGLPQDANQLAALSSMLMQRLMTLELIAMTLLRARTVEDRHHLTHFFSEKHNVTQQDLDQELPKLRELFAVNKLPFKPFYDQYKQRITLLFDTADYGKTFDRPSFEKGLGGVEDLELRETLTDIFEATFEEESKKNRLEAALQEKIAAKNFDPALLEKNGEVNLRDIDTSVYLQGVYAPKGQPRAYYETVDAIFPEQRRIVGMALFGSLEELEYRSIHAYLKPLFEKEIFSDRDLGDILQHWMAASKEQSTKSDPDELARQTKGNSWTHFTGNPVSPGLRMAGSVAVAGTAVIVGGFLVFNAPLVVVAGRLGWRMAAGWVRGLLSLTLKDYAIAAVLSIIYTQFQEWDNLSNGIPVEEHLALRNGKNFVSFVLFMGGIKALKVIHSALPAAIMYPTMTYSTYAHANQGELYQMSFAAVLSLVAAYEGLVYVRRLMPSPRALDSQRLRFRYRFSHENPEIPERFFNPAEAFSKRLSQGSERLTEFEPTTNTPRPTHNTPQPSGMGDVSAKAQTLTMERPTDIEPMSIAELEAAYRSDIPEMTIEMTIASNKMGGPIIENITFGKAEFVPPSDDVSSSEDNDLLIPVQIQEFDENGNIILIRLAKVTKAELRRLQRSHRRQIISFSAEAVPSATTDITSPQGNNGGSSGALASGDGSAKLSPEEELVELGERTRDRIINLYTRYGIPLADLMALLKAIITEFNYPPHFAVTRMGHLLKKNVPLREIINRLKELQSTNRPTSSLHDEVADVQEEVARRQALQETHDSSQRRIEEQQPNGGSEIAEVELSGTFIRKVEKGAGEKINELVNQFGVTRTQVHMALKTLMDGKSLSVAKALPYIEQYLNAHYGEAEELVLPSIKERAEHEIGGPFTSEDGVVNPGYRFQTSRKNLKPEQIREDKMAGMNAFMRSKGRVPHRNPKTKEEELLAETIADHGGYSVVYPFFDEDVRSLPLVKAYVDSPTAAALVEAYYYKYGVFPRPISGGISDDAYEWELSIITKYHGGMKSLRPHLSQQLRDELHQKEWTDPLTELNRIVAETKDWPLRTDYPDICNWIWKHGGRSEIYKHLTPDNQNIRKVKSYVDAIRNPIDGMEVINNWIAAAKRFPKSLVKKWRAGELTEKEKIERNIYIAIGNRGGIKRNYPNLTPENQALHLVRIQGAPLEYLQEWIVENKREPLDLLKEKKKRKENDLTLTPKETIETDFRRMTERRKASNGKKGWPAWYLDLSEESRGLIDAGKGGRQ